MDARIEMPKALDDGCTGPVCHPILRIDYLSGTYLGYQVLSQQRDAIGEDRAVAIAMGHFEEKLFGAEPRATVTDRRHLWEIFGTTGDFAGYVLVSKLSGEIVAAGGEVWAGQGTWWEPQSWLPKTDLVAGHTQHNPKEQAELDPSICRPPNGSTPSNEHLLQRALMSNLAATFAAKGDFDVFSRLYKPKGGHCDPRVAELVVVFTQERSAP